MSIEHLKTGDLAPKPSEPRSEAEIMAGWKGDWDKPVVSICCIAFNHEKYIEDALNGFLNQKTNFPFEILIHDDASNDLTPRIIRDYERRYPNIVKAIYQVENQFSKGKRPNPEFNFPRAAGDFVALCEGDDFWIDTNKLNKQVRNIASFPECDMCFHETLSVDSKDRKVIRRMVGDLGAGKSIFQAEDVLQKGISFISTSSLLVRTEFLMREEIIGFLRDYGSAFFIKFLSSTSGGAVYVSDMPMSVYRVLSDASYTLKARSDSEYALCSILDINNNFDKANQLTDYKYSSLFKKLKNKGVSNLILSGRLSSRQNDRLFEGSIVYLNFFNRTLFNLRCFVRFFPSKLRRALFVLMYR
ncbi:glycosyltransferase family 2 protein [Marinobacter sp. SBS5]|uniref:glycosyltransferase family 2 protein n=1 Tax=Marinobacter sp. SBS5 TaxID=3401754 RepID=UPI003AAF4403